MIIKVANGTVKIQTELGDVLELGNNNVQVCEQDDIEQEESKTVSSTDVPAPKVRPWTIEPAPIVERIETKTIRVSAFITPIQHHLLKIAAAKSNRKIEEFLTLIISAVVEGADEKGYAAAART